MRTAMSRDDMQARAAGANAAWEVPDGEAASQMEHGARLGGPGFASGDDDASASSLDEMGQLAAVWQARELGWEQLVEFARELGPDPALSDVSDEELDRRVRVQAAELAAATCRWLELLAELVVRGVWAVEGAKTPAQWLSWTIGMAGSTARDHVRVALQLRELPRLRERFAAGQLSYSKVRALTRVAVPTLEPMLLEWADAATAAEIERVVSGFRRTRRATAMTAHDREQAREVSRRPGPDGMTELVVRVLPEEADEIEALLDRLVDLDRERGRVGSAGSPGDGAEGGVAAAVEGGAETEGGEPGQQPALRLVEDPAPEVDSGEAAPARASGVASSGETLRGGTASGEAPGEAPGGASSGVASSGGTAEGLADGPLAAPAPPRGAARVDALVHALVATVAAGPPDTSGADRHTLVLHTDATDLVADPAAAGPTLDLADLADNADPADEVMPGRSPARRGRGALVPVEDRHGRSLGMDRRVLRRLACEAGIVLVVRDEAGTPIDVGRRDRRLSAALRRALLARDRSCRFPGCGATRNLHAHHVHHWADGGPTDLANLVLVCATHHRFVHDHGWILTPAGAGRFTFAPPGGPPLPAACAMPDPGTATDDDRLDVPTVDDPHQLLPESWPGPGYADIDLAVAVLDQELRRVLPAHLTAAA